MIAEWLTSLRIPCEHHIRQLGYHKKLVGLAFRYKRQRKHWQAHQQNTRESILAAIKECTDKNVAMVLGAGALLDVPLEELCTQFNQVHLVDVVFLPSTLKEAARHKNCHIIESDITGTLKAVYDFDMKTKELPSPTDPLELSKIIPSLTLSVNILSQLPLIPSGYLEKISKGALKEGEGLLKHFGHDLIAHHLAWLRSLPGRVCLICDEKIIYFRQEPGKKEEIIVVEDPMYGNTLPSNSEAWVWMISPKGESEKHIGIWHQVRAINLK